MAFLSCESRWVQFACPSCPSVESFFFCQSHLSAISWSAPKSQGCSLSNTFWTLNLSDEKWVGISCFCFIGVFVVPVALVAKATQVMKRMSSLITV